MTPAGILAELYHRGITVTACGDVLNLEPKELVTPEVKALALEHKSALLQLLAVNANGNGHGPRVPGFESILAALDDLPPSPSAEALDGPLRLIAHQLGSADALTRALSRADLIARLDALRVQAPARIVDAALGGVGAEDGEASTAQGQRIVLADPEPWPAPVDVAALLEEITSTLTRFVILPPGGAEALALAIANTYTHDAARISPLVALLSPEPRCGKSTVLDLACGMVRRPLPAANITAASLFRAVEKFSPTLLVDEADSFLTDSDELRGILNSGHTRATAVVVRTVGDDHEPRTFTTWCPKFVAKIGRLPATLEDRSITVPMRRRAPGEAIERLRRDRLELLLEPLRRKLARWAVDALPPLREADPVVPPDLHDRAADSWRPLLAIADLAGGAWPARAAAAAQHLSGASAVRDDSLRVQLLGDLRDLFREQDVDQLRTSRIVELLVRLDERPWGECNRGRPITARQLASLLKPFGVAPVTIRDGLETPKGYRLADLADPLARYLPSPNPQHPQQTNGDEELEGIFDPQQTTNVADSKQALSTYEKRNVADVADPDPGFWEEGGL